jgi:protein-tyrosine phosphatase
MSEWFERFGFGPVSEDLLTGAYPLDADDVGRLSEAGVDVAYNLCEDAEYEEGQREAALAALAEAGIVERRLPLVDYGRLSAEQLEEALGDVMDELDGGRSVYVHCRAGWQRSAAIAAAVIAAREDIPLQEALARIRERRPTAEPLPHQRADLFTWWSERHA